MNGDMLFELKRKFDNFMYHYKFLLLAALAVIAILLYAAAQCAAKGCSPREASVREVQAVLKGWDVYLPNFG